MLLLWVAAPDHWHGFTKDAIPEGFHGFWPWLSSWLGGLMLILGGMLMRQAHLRREAGILGQLAASEARFRAYAEHAPVGMAEEDVAGRIRYANPCLLHLLQHDAVWLRQHGWRGMLASDERRHAPPPGEKWRGECGFRLADGSVRWLLVCQSPLMLHGKQAGGVVMFVDIGMQRELLHRVRRMGQKMLDVEEETRQEIARALHDDLAQLLVSVKMEAESLAISSPGDLQAVERIARQAGEALNLVRRQIGFLRLDVIDELGLEASLRSMVERWALMHAVACECRIHVPGECPSRAATAVYRLVQEALSNVARHACASRVRVEVRQDMRRLLVQVADNGRGLEGAKPEGLGLEGMRERIESLCGSLEVLDAGGTVVRAEIPLFAGSDRK